MRTRKNVLYNYVVNKFGLSRELVLEYVNARLEDLVSKLLKDKLDSKEFEKMALNRITQIVTEGMSKETFGGFYYHKEPFDDYLKVVIRQVLENKLNEEYNLETKFVRKDKSVVHKRQLEKIMKIQPKSDPDKRINHRDFFESCYMRHQYLLKVKIPPTREEMEPYYKIVENFCRNTFYIYKNLFLMVGLDLEDVMENGKIQLISYLGLFALEKNPKKLAEFKRNFRSRNSIICSKEDILDKNKANFTCFLKQRLEDMVRVCRQKARNIKGLIPEDFVVFKGVKRPPKDIEDLLENHEKYGYSPLNISVFKTIKKRMKDRQEGPVYLDNKTWYVCVPIRKKTLSLTDFTCNNYDPYDNLHNMTPEEVFSRSEGNDWEGKWLRFNSIPDEERAAIVQEFIVKNTKNPTYKKELRAARKFLESLDGESDV